MSAVCAGLDRERLSWAAELAGLPHEIRGFGPVKAQAMEAYWARRAALLAAEPGPALRTGTR